MDIREKVTIITGASTGIGRATARLFAEHGAMVVLAARSADKLDALARELQSQGREALAVPTDVTQEDAVQTLVAKTIEAYGRVDILVNNAGVGGAGPIADFPADAYRQLIDLNVLGPYYGMRAVIPHMREHGGGLIINISSSATTRVFPTVGPYTSTKHALNSLSAAARLELAPDNIRVISVYPDYTASDFSKGSLQFGAIAAYDLPEGDSPEKVAQKIFEAAIDEPTDTYVT
ncbi:MAG: SDR family oxidoreductase [Anaerolineae bacterium]|nr:SDR family oxidoreductase [Anaerolineae bacterium]